MTEKNLIEQAAEKKAIAKKDTKKKTLLDLIKVMEPEIKKALPSVLSPERFTRIVLSAISTNPRLAECTPQSFLGAMMTSAQLGMEVNTPLGQAYIIPFRNKGVLEAQFQLGYKGLIDLAYRSGEVSIIQAHAVYENDVFEYELGLDPKLKHIPAETNRGKVIAYYAMFKTKSDGYGFEVMSAADIEEHARRYSKSFGNGPWQTNFDEMSKKTVLKRVLKYAPLKSDFVRAVTQDETVKTQIDADMYSVPDETVYAEAIDAEYTVDDNTGEVLLGVENGGG